MQSKYREYRQLDLPEVEKEILQAWESESSFQKSIEIREGSRPFVFYEGPPSANGMPGIHHVISRTLKDMVCRYKTMTGHQVKRKGGWDTHGLPVELGVEKELGITKEDIGKTISVEDYNRRCREAVLRYKDKWDDLTRRMGYWVDLDNPYVPSRTTTSKRSGGASKGSTKRGSSTRVSASSPIHRRPARASARTSSTSPAPTRR